MVVVIEKGGSFILVDFVKHKNVVNLLHWMCL